MQFLRWLIPAAAEPDPTISILLHRVAPLPLRPVRAGLFRGGGSGKSGKSQRSGKNLGQAAIHPTQARADRLLRGGKSGTSYSPQEMRGHHQRERPYRRRPHSSLSSPPSALGGGGLCLTSASIDVSVPSLTLLFCWRVASNARHHDPIFLKRWCRTVVDPRQTGNV
jgi:hypothetical protein